MNEPTQPVSTAVKSLSQAAIGRALGLAPSTMTKLKGQGMPVDSIEAARAWRSARQSIAARKPEPGAAPGPAPAADGREGGAGIPGDQVESYDAARTRREIAEANAAEMKADKLRGELIPLDVAARAVFLAGRSVRDALQASRRRLAPSLASATDVAECEEIQRKDHQQILAELAAGLAKVGCSTEDFLT